MADNTTLDPGTGGDTIRDKDRAGVKTPIVGLDLNPSGSEVLGTGDATNGLDVDVTRVQGTVTVNGSGVTQPVSAASLPLPTGASTAVKQPALGTAGTASADVISVQGVASMTALKVDGSGVTQPVSGTVTASGPLTDTQLRASAVPTTDSQTIADNAGFTDGTSKVFPVGLIFDEVAGTALTENDIGAARMDAKRAAVGVLEDATTRGQRAAVSAGGALKVDNSAVTQPVSGTVSITANSAVNVAQMAGTTTDTNSGTKSAGTQRVVLATDQPQLTNALKVDGSAVTQPVSGTVTANAGTGTLAVKLTPQTTGGLSIFRSIDLDETEEDVKTSAGQLFGWYLFNAHTATLYVKIYNATAANVTVGTTTPVLTIPVPAGAGANVLGETGIAFATAISAACTTGVADSDTGAPAANVLIANFFYA